MKNFKDTGKSVSSKKNGRPRISFPGEERPIKKTALSDSFQTAASISREVNESYVAKVFCKTVSRRLNEIDLFARSPAKKNLISNKNKKLKLSVAQEHVLWTDDQLRNVFVSDESKFNVLGSDG